MNAMRAAVLLVCSLAVWISVLDTKGAAPRVPDAATTTATRGGAPARGGIPLLHENQSGRLFPVPPDARVVRHDAGGKRSAGDALLEDTEKLIYSNNGDPFEILAYSPPIARARIGDDIFTNAVGNCPINSYSIRVNGGIPNGFSETFETRVALTTYCPSTDYWGPTIPGTALTFPNLVADIDTIHELVVDLTDPNIGICATDAGCRIDEQDCYDGSECVTRTEPVIIPSQVWLRVEFSTAEAGWIFGTPPTVGFSTDTYDNYFTGCNSSFGGYPDHPHASFYAQFWASAKEGVCPTHFLAYLAFDAEGDAFDAPPTGTLNQLLADDIELIVDRCELSTIEVGTKGTHGPYEIDFDLRTFPTDDPMPGTEFHWVSSQGSGNANLDIARLVFDEGIFVPRNFWLVWRANKPDTGLINVGHTQIGGQCRTPSGLACNMFFGWYGGPWAGSDEWDTRRQMLDGSDAVFYVAVYCRGEEPVGPCCGGQPDLPDQDPACIDNVPASFCLDGRWLDSTDDPDRIKCPSTFYDGLCEDGSPCDVLAQDCPDSSCTAGVDCECEETEDPWEAIGQPACGTHACCKPDNECADLPRDECVAITEDETGNPAVWNRGDFCEFNGQRCPYFACYYSSVACTDCSPDVWCDYEDDPICEEQIGPGSYCKMPDRTCTIPRGCADVSCCDSVCNATGNSICCNVGWDCTCSNLARDCPGPPANDNCWDDQRGFGAIEIRLTESPWDPTFYYGSSTSRLLRATSGASEPGMCCHIPDVNEKPSGTVWYKFRAAQSGSVRLHTCGTAGQSDAEDSIIQVFSAPFTDLGLCEDGSGCTMGQMCPDDACETPPCECYLNEQRLCENLVVEGCNDDATVACGNPLRPGLSDLCIPEVTAGELYYVMVGTGSIEQQGDYRLDIEQPCDSGDIPPYASFCEGAWTAYPGVNAYDLAAATLDCPGEPCVPAMQNDVWFWHQPECTGYLLVRTCDLDPATPEEDTTLAVYQGLDCPPGEDDLLGCNDNAVSSPRNRGVHGMPQWCAGVLTGCDQDADCPKTCTIGEDVCEGYADCDIGVCEDGSSCSVRSQNCDDRFPCQRAEDCDPPLCISACWPGAMVEVPVSDAEWYKIRVGGYFGSEPSGDLTITCRQEDCNFNHVPDVIDILDCLPGDPTCDDCNQNGVPDICDLIYHPDIWKDCDDNFIPDRCQISFDCVGPESPYFCNPAEGPCDPDVNNNCIVDSCEPACPAGAMDWAGANPPNGVIDARQPHPLNGLTAQGIYTIIVDGPAGMTKGHKCFDLCETRVAGSENFVATVTEGPPGTYTIRLDRPISAGAVTKIRYHDDGGSPPDTAVFTSLPADVNAGGLPQVNDIAELVSCCLGGTCAPAYGGYSCDVNHSGLTTSEDVLRLIDLLHGADHFAAWKNKPVHDEDECP